MNSRTSGSGGATRPTLLGVLLGLRVVTRVSWLIEPVTLELANVRRGHPAISSIYFGNVSLTAGRIDTEARLSRFRSSACPSGRTAARRRHVAQHVTQL